MVDNKLSKLRIRNHFTYNAWKYLIVIVFAVFIWSMAYNMTAYRPPDDKKLDIYIAVAGADTDALQADLQEEIEERFPDQEKVNFLYIGLGSDDDYASTMQFTTYLAAGEGDIYLMPRDRFLQLARDGDDESNALLALDDYIDQGVIDPRGIDVQRGTVNGRIRGIPVASLYGLLDFGIVPQSLYLVIPSYSSNQDNAAKMIDLLIERYLSEEPEWYADYLRQQQMNLNQQQLDNLNNQ